MEKEIVYFGMGCFWGPQKIFNKVAGVLNTEVGFMGGAERFSKVTYLSVSTGITGHAEVIKIEFDSDKISFDKLLDLFWKKHNATELNKQGPDVGKQYRSVIFFTSKEQKKEAKESLENVQKKIGKDRKIVTKIEKAGRFHKAEEYHQDYLKKNNGTCHFGSTFT